MREQATGPSNTPLQTAPSFGRGRLRLLGRSFLLLLAATALQAAPASAIVYVMPTDESMVDRSPIIVFGEVLHAQPSLDLSRPATDYLFAVEEVMKGFLAGSAIIVRQPGGIGADGTAMSVVGLPMLSEGSRVLLFLQPEVNGAHGIVGYGLGTLFEARVGDRVFLLREPSLQGAVALPGGRASSNPGGRQGYREAGAFRHWIADRAAGVQRPSDYFEAELPDATAAVASPFRLLQEECAAAEALPVQPPNFDRGETIAFEVQSGGQPGVQGDGVSHVRTAMRVWNTYPGSNVNLEYAGTTASPPRLYDGANSITFEDPHDEIEGSFVPGEGGTLALATTWWTCGAGRGIGGLHAHDLRRTSLTTQDGFQSYLRQFEASTAERIFQDTIAHELGHALDLDEACEPDQSRCDPSRERRGALMWPENDPGSGLTAARRPSMAATESGLDLAIESPDSTEVSIVPSASSARRDPAADFDLSSGNGYAFGIVYAESRFHVVDRTDRKVYAYRGSDGRPDPAADFDLDSGNANAYGITYAQSRFYIVDRTDKKVYAYRGSDGRRDPVADFDLHSGNANPYGITYAEGRFHVVDRTDGKVYAYRGSDGRRDAAADFNLNSDNSHPYEIAYAQGRFYVADRTDRKVYVYPVDGSGGGAAPDLVVESPRSTESSVAPGGAFRFAATVRNNGDERSAATTLRYYRSSDSRITTSDTRIGSDAIGALSASATDRQSIGQRAPATPGTYYYGACVDSVDGESDTTNNCSSGVAVTVVSGGTDDVIDTGFDLAFGNGDGSGIVHAQGRFYVLDQLDPKVYAYRGSDGRHDAAADFDLAPSRRFSSGITYAQGRFYVLDDEKVYAYRGSDGRYDSLADFDLASDNQYPRGITYAQGRFYVLDRTDHKVYAYRGSDGRHDFAADFDLATDSRFDNRFPEGITYAEGRFYVVGQGDGTVYAYRGSDGRHDAAADFDLATRNNSPFGITYAGGRLFVLDNFDDRVYAYSVDGSRRPPPAPDLVVRNASVSDSSPRAGSRFTLNATVRNQGDDRSAATTLRYYLSSNATINTSDTQVGTDSIGALSASGTSAESINLTAPSSAGTYYYGACVDSVSDEESTSNNCSSGVRVTVGGGSTDDHGDTLADATSIAVPSTTAGELENGGDNDYFRLVVDQSTTLTVETTGSTDTYGTLFDGSGASQESNDDDGAGANFKIERDVGAGTYYVNVRGYSSTTTGRYELRASTSGTGGGSGPDLGNCRANLVVNPGQTCTYKGYTFSVDSSGTARIAFFQSTNRIYNTGTVNGVRWNFDARRNAGSNSWTIHVAD